MFNWYGSLWRLQLLGETVLTFGHDVKLMGAQFVKPYVKSNKNDWLDAEAICEAVQRPSMRFVSIKETWQQDIPSLHRSRGLFVKNKTALSNQTRGLLTEYGIVIKQGIAPLLKQLPSMLDDVDNELTSVSRELFQELYEELKFLIEKVKSYDKKIAQLCKSSIPCQKLVKKMAGVGPILATAMVATVGNAKAFKNGREMSAYIGLVPRQYSTGGKQKLLEISKRGDCYLRGLLIHGARAVLYSAKHLSPEKSTWLQTLAQRRGVNKAIVALANKNVRVMWALLTKEEAYKPA